MPNEQSMPQRKHVVHLVDVTVHKLPEDDSSHETVDEFTVDLTLTTVKNWLSRLTVWATCRDLGIQVSRSTKTAPNFYPRERDISRSTAASTK